MGTRPCTSCGGAGSRLVSKSVPNPHRTGMIMMNVQVSEPCGMCHGSGRIYAPDPRPPRTPRPPRKTRAPKPKKPARGAPVAVARNETDVEPRAPKPPRPAGKGWSAEQFIGLGAAVTVVWLAARNGARPEWYWWPITFLGVLVGSVFVLKRVPALTKLICFLILLAIVLGVGMMVFRELK